MSNNRILAVILHVNQIPEIHEIEDRLAVYQETVGGDIRLLPWRPDVLVYVNEDQRRTDLPFNVGLDGHIVRGPLLVTGHAGRGLSRQLSLDEAKAIVKHLREMPRNLLSFNKHLCPIAAGMIAKQRASTARKASRSPSASSPKPRARHVALALTEPPRR